MYVCTYTLKQMKLLHVYSERNLETLTVLYFLNQACMANTGDYFSKKCLCVCAVCVCVCVCMCVCVCVCVCSPGA